MGKEFVLYFVITMLELCCRLLLFTADGSYFNTLIWCGTNHREQV